MAKIRRGGVTGFARGRAGNYVYAVMPGSATTSGSREQIVRQAPDGVSNPKTTAQSLQRMKVGPAQRFYNAFKELLSNAFQSVNYGNPSRRYFLSEAMKADGPYIPKGVDRFIPAEYLFSDGSLPSVKLMDRSNMFSEAGGQTVLNLDYQGVAVTSGYVTASDFADALGVGVDTQISIVVVTNNNGIFTPHYLGFDERIKIEDLPVDSVSSNQSYVSILLSKLELPQENLVAAAVVLSKQDASGKWLRSRQFMQVNATLYDQIYSTDAYDAAVASYGANATNNALGSLWYYNLGISSQAFDGQIVVTSNRYWKITDTTVSTPFPIGKNPVMGRLADGKWRFFGEINGTTASLIVCTDEQAGTLESIDLTDWDTARNHEVLPWDNAYAAQAGLSPMAGEA